MPTIKKQSLFLSVVTLILIGDVTRNISQWKEGKGNLPTPPALIPLRYTKTNEDIVYILLIEAELTYLHILGDPGAVSWRRAKWRDESFQERAVLPPVLENFRRAISPAPD